MKPLAMIASLLLTAMIGTGCGEPEGPAVRVALQVLRAPDVDTSDVTGFFIIVGEAGQAIVFDEINPVPIELNSPPEPDTAIIVYGCEFRNAACNAAGARFIGCKVVDLAPAEASVVVEIELDEKVPLPAACAAIGAE